MPKKDGLTVMEHCSHDSSVKKQPAFIVVSAVGQERITEDAFNLGAYYYMLKPFDKQVLLSRIKHIRRGNERKMRETGATGGERGTGALRKTESGNRCDEYYT